MTYHSNIYEMNHEEISEVLRRTREEIIEPSNTKLELNIQNEKPVEKLRKYNTILNGIYDLAMKQELARMEIKQTVDAMLAMRKEKRVKAASLNDAGEFVGLMKKLEEYVR